MKKRTIRKDISFSGIGLHTGLDVKVNIRPADGRHGIKFQRIDLETQPLIPADVNYVVDTRRGTTLERSGCQVKTVEHILSALYGLSIDNALIEVNGPEIPILDGSAQAFVRSILDVGIEELEDEKEYFEVDEAIHFTDEDTGSEYTVFPAEHFEITSLVDFSGKRIGQQYAHLKSLDKYSEEIALCRTFVFASELEELFNQGLVKGGDVDNALVIVDRGFKEEQFNKLKQLFGKEDLEVVEEGFLNNIQPYFKNEPARHKLLDIVGDLALVGVPIIGKVIAKKPGHTSNIGLARLLKQKYVEQKRLRGKPKYDPSKAPIMDVQTIKGFLPHRYPFLLVDKIIELSDSHVVGIKNITANEGFFQGHFPGNPIFPGVLQMEALAQTGGILALNTVNVPDNWDTYFLKMEKVRFKQKVVPGDTLILKMELLSPIRRGIVHMQGTAYVGNKIVSEGELTAQIVDRTTL